jgi:hypothetical protein
MKDKEMIQERFYTQSTPAKLFKKRFGMWAICHSLSNDFYEVFELEKNLIKCETKDPIAIFCDI